LIHQVFMRRSEVELFGIIILKSDFTLFTFVGADLKPFLVVCQMGLAQVPWLVIMITEWAMLSIAHWMMHVHKWVAFFGWTKVGLE